MEWIVLGTKNGAVMLTSKGNQQGVLPKGSYLTIDSQSNKSGKEINQTKFIYFKSRGKLSERAFCSYPFNYWHGFRCHAWR